MKKVAIMTWIHYHNFGTALQVTALSRTIEKLGYQADVIQYIPHGKLVTLQNYKNPMAYLNKINNKINSKNIRSVLDEKREEAFNKFLNSEIRLTTMCRIDADLFSLNNQFDAFVCGSDQIWAPTLFNPKYFLSFVEDSNKMIAYAPSIGVSKIEDVYVRNRMKECIERFKYLSIREEQGQKLIKEICNRNSRVVLDPTFLLTADEWNSIAAKRKEGNPYILCYFLGNSKKSWNHVRKLSKTTGLPLKIIPVFSQDLKRCFDVVSGIGPAEFLSLIKNANFVCTDSFHGTAFSIIYERPFYTYERFSNRDSNSQNTRIYNILKIVNLEDRIVKDKSNVNGNPLICEFKNSKHKLEIKMKKSINYLKNSLNKSATPEDRKQLFKITNTCCGCGTCASICIHNAIEIKRNKEGFLAAIIDPDKCVSCGLCVKVCPYNGKTSEEINKTKHKLFMVRSTDFSILNTSSSGGAGYEISRMLSQQGYDVVGCTYDKESGEAFHQLALARDIEKLQIFQGSKYIQSNSVDAFRNIEKSSKKTVVFGTPCQISGIDRLLKLKGKRDRFILVDLICHGVPTQNLWKKYLKEGSEKYGYGLSPKVTFRYKPKGWRKMYMSVEGNGKSYTCLDKKDSFYRFFLLNNCYMSACYECGYRTVSAADIRLGDYWGPRYEKVKDGVSMVIALSNTGEEVLKSLNNANKIEIQEMDCKEYWTVQYPQNPIKPVFYEELINGLKDESVPLQTLITHFCKGYEFYKKLYKLYFILLHYIKKLGEIK